MALALPLIAELFQPINTMVEWLAGGPAPVAPSGPGGATVAARPSGRAAHVVHVVNARESRSARGMVLSGRVDEVCAELDRLAALDARH